MRHLLKWTVISVFLASSLGPVIAQNTPTPKAEDAEKNAFETPTAGKSATDTLKNTKGQSSDRVFRILTHKRHSQAEMLYRSLKSKEGWLASDDPSTND